MWPPLACSSARAPGASRAGRAPFPPRECPPLPPRPPSASDWIVRSSLSKLAFAELDAEPAPRVVPLQGAGGGDRQAGAALQAGRVLDRDGSVGFLGVDVSGAAGDYGLAGSGRLGDLLVDLDVALLLIEVEAVLGQALGDGQWFHRARAPAMPSLTSCLIFSGD